MSLPLAHDIHLPTLDIGYRLYEWPSDGPTIVIVHGFLDGGLGFRGFIESGLSARARVFAPDMRGHGDSGRVAGGYYHFPDYVADLHDVINHIGADKIWLVGHSMGGSIASYYAAAFPEKVEKLALLEGLGPREDETSMPQRLSRWISDVHRSRARESRYDSREAAIAALHKHDKLLDDAVAEALADDMLKQDERGFYFAYDRMHLTRGPYRYQVTQAQEFWQALRCPVLLVSGGSSEFLRSENDELQRRESMFPPGTKRIVIPDAGHMMHRHAPQALAAALLEFFFD